MRTSISILDNDYREWVKTLATRYKNSQIKAAVKVNSEKLFFNWLLGRDIVEMHVNSSDWDLHQHSSDLAYQNVILHVVWNHDKEIDYLRSRNVETLILKDFVAKEVVFNYEKLISNKRRHLFCSDVLKKVNWESALKNRIL